uniref:Uncharacterized protein n=1 Tax=Romanomermis culicivorax TaxID=13658 RepID=A0A915ICX4_ROMCU
MVVVNKGNTSRLAGDRYLFQARCSNVKDLHAILKAIAFNEDALINVSSSGVRVIVEDVKCLQANAFLQTELFDEFVLKEETVNFCLNINVL